MRTLTGLLALLLLAPLAGAGDALDSKSWRKTLSHVLPDKAELRWQDVEWNATLWDAVIEAHKEKKPILLWAMNGHAMACT